MATASNSSGSTSGRITAQDAAKKAADYLRSFSSQAHNIKVEEVELDPNDESEWRITLSYVSLDEPFAGRALKLFRVDVQTGEVLGMRMRKG